MTDNVSTAVSDLHVAALRTFLIEGPDVWQEQYGEQIKDETDTGYSLLIYCTLAKAAALKFSPAYSFPQLIRYVADLRLSLEEHAHELNPRVAENTLRLALGDKTLSERPPFGVDQVTVVRAQIYLLMALVLDAEFNETELEQFIRDSGESAREWVATWWNEARSI
ncbi:hypothetical protein ACQPZP_19995 [Spirillospora sp. CA-142024]|uniref:hypothetical protein n=1 Tax=Spirillospora sp. CA-142024 TaxID=3240036 RepID=UPI003D92C981